MVSYYLFRLTKKLHLLGHESYFLKDTYLFFVESLAAMLILWLFFLLSYFLIVFRPHNQVVNNGVGSFRDYA
jgi:hypothetical protein